MSIVSLESADEKNVSASILNFLTAYGVISLLSKCGGTKLKEDFTMKKFSLHKLFMAFALVLGLVMMSAPSADAKDLNLVNRTGEDIIVLNCSPSISDSWFNDVLGNSIWRNGETIIIDFDRWQLSDTWDFKVHYADGASEDWYGVNVRTVNTIILYNNGRNEYQ